MKIFCIVACGVMLLACSAVWASPVQNAQQFQQKAARAAAKGNYEKSHQSPSKMIKASDKGFVSPPSGKSKADAVRITPADDTEKPVTAGTETE